MGKENFEEASDHEDKADSESEDPDNGGFMKVLNALCQKASGNNAKKNTWSVEKSTSIEACHEKNDKKEKCDICGRTTAETSTCFIARSFEILKQI